MVIANYRRHLLHRVRIVIIERKNESVYGRQVGLGDAFEALAQQFGALVGNDCDGHSGPSSFIGTHCNEGFKLSCSNRTSTSSTSPLSGNVSLFNSALGYNPAAFRSA